ELPVKAKKKPPKPVSIAVAVLENADGHFVISKRPSDGLLANLWEFPNREVENRRTAKNELQQFFKDNWGVHVDIQKQILEFEHVFSHLIWELNVYRGKLHTELSETEDVKLVSMNELERYPFPVSHQKIIGRLAE